MSAVGLERGFAVVVGAVLIVLGLVGSLVNPVVGRPESEALLATGAGHDLVHIVTGALFVHVGLALNGRNRAHGLVVLGGVLLVMGLVSLISSDLFGLYGAREVSRVTPSQAATPLRSQPQWRRARRSRGHRPVPSRSRMRRPRPQA